MNSHNLLILFPITDRVRSLLTPTCQQTVPFWEHLPSLRTPPLSFYRYMPTPSPSDWSGLATTSFRAIRILPMYWSSGETVLPSPERRFGKGWVQSHCLTLCQSHVPSHPLEREKEPNTNKKSRGEWYQGAQVSRVRIPEKEFHPWDGLPKVLIISCVFLFWCWFWHSQLP